MKAYKKSVGEKTFDIINYMFMTFLVIIMLYPFLNILAVSLSNRGAVAAGKVTFYPIGFNLIGYELVFSGTRIWRSYLNTIIYAGVGTAASLLFTSMIAYTLCVKDFVARKPLTIYFAVTMFFSGGMITTYLLIRNLDLFNTIWAMTLPTAISAYNIFVYRAFMQGISMQLRESAKIDGANDAVILFRIYLPLSKALLATFGLFSVVGHWNSWYPALLYLRNRDMHPIQMVLREVLFVSGAQGGTFDRVAEFVTTKELHPKNVQMACVMATTAPILIAYPFVQKHFMKGVMIGSIKG